MEISHISAEPIPVYIANIQKVLRTDANRLEAHKVTAYLLKIPRDGKVLRSKF